MRNFWKKTRTPINILINVKPTKMVYSPHVKCSRTFQNCRSRCQNLSKLLEVLHLRVTRTAAFDRWVFVGALRCALNPITVQLHLGVRILHNGRNETGYRVFVSSGSGTRKNGVSSLHWSCLVELWLQINVFEVDHVFFMLNRLGLSCMSSSFVLFFCVFSAKIFFTTNP